ncbi:hypothetical protein BDV27DRAFT_95888 [Aspergillus caelatus]|uniref:Uncharacterized protein n=1 Tax=Aspergillus caelatus TaxID=61420 RepID=A0A5N7A877_9EURO|nr:uncharacterized protein BDV27DRAFT_95888 [Aspergillus caelatus]KAE8366067.1 hypothetical protein BDV27DRAFT_95888 [Aspergillus caelatus]
MTWMVVVACIGTSGILRAKHTVLLPTPHCLSETIEQLAECYPAKVVSKQSLAGLFPPLAPFSNAAIRIHSFALVCPQRCFVGKLAVVGVALLIFVELCGLDHVS